MKIIYKWWLCCACALALAACAGNGWQVKGVYEDPEHPELRIELTSPK